MCRELATLAWASSLIGRRKELAHTKVADLTAINSDRGDPVIVRYRGVSGLGDRTRLTAANPHNPAAVWNLRFPAPSGGQQGYGIVAHWRVVVKPPLEPTSAVRDDNATKLH